MADKLFLNDLLGLSEEQLANTKIRFNKGADWIDPLEEYKRDKDVINTQWFLHRSNRNYFNVGQYAICLVRMPGDRWLFTTMKTIIKDNGVTNGVAYEGEEWKSLSPLYGRLVVKYHSTFQQPVVFANTVMKDLEVLEILPDPFLEDPFPGYDRVRLDYPHLQRILDRQPRDWVAALEHQKGVYVITDMATGKLYVGSATAKEGMLLKRWSDYVANGHGGDVALIEVINTLGMDYVRENFQYSLLENYNARVDDHVILERESWWKDTLDSRKHGYNRN
ncbi:GIY-YIG nuclease family protein [Bifidobacterium apri]|uniref:GIY-YIG nuclease family protein n=1 Tax=Bifidobacterium apri TaxID=1769423 RepID=UPI00399321A7